MIENIIDEVIPSHWTYLTARFETNILNITRQASILPCPTLSRLASPTAEDDNQENYRRNPDLPKCQRGRPQNPNSLKRHRISEFTTSSEDWR